METVVCTGIVDALSQLHHHDVTPVQRRQAEKYLIAFRSSDNAWGLCLTLAAHSDLFVQLFAAQTLRHKLRQQGYALQQEQLQQLRHMLLQSVVAVAVVKPLLARQLCSALSALALIEGSWTTVINDLAAALPLEQQLTFLQLLAEDAASDTPALTAAGPSHHLEAALAARRRCLGWAQQVAELLLQQAQQHANNQQLLLVLLPCASAWVRLGALHEVHPTTASSLVATALQLLQAQADQVVEAAAAVLLEVAESAPQELLAQLIPASCCSLAAAACQAAAAKALHRAFCWCRAAVGLMAAQPSLLWGPSTIGTELRAALMQVTVLGDILESNLVCLPALEVWAGMLGDDATTTGSSVTAGHPPSGHMAAASSSSRPRSPADDSRPNLCGLHQAPVTIELQPVFQQLLPGLMTNWLAWQQQPDGQDALAAEGVTCTFLDTLAVGYQVLGASQYMLAALQLADPTAQAIGRQAAAAGPPQPELEAASAAAAAGWAPTQNGDGSALDTSSSSSSIWAGLPQGAAGVLSAAPLAGRLQGALMMAAAPSRAEGADVAHTWGRKQQESTDACRYAARLVLGAASLMHTAVSEQQVVPEGCSHAFCEAVQVWAPCVLQHGPASAAEGLTMLTNMLQLLLTVAQSGEDPDTVAAACTAVKALLHAAAAAGWDGLPSVVGLPIQAVEVLGLGSSNEQELLQAACTCLGGSGTQQRTLRCQVAQQLLAPCYTLLHSLQQQVTAGARWDTFGPASEGQLVHLLTRARVLLEYSLQQLHRDQGTTAGRPLCRRRSVDIDPGLMESILGSGAMGGSPLSGDHMAAAAGASQRQAATAAVLQEPALQLLLVELWPLVHMLCAAGASGRLLQVHAKCVAAVLRAELALALEQLGPFLGAAAACFTRPGGSGFAEPLVVVLEACCDPAADWPLDTRHLIFQALQRIWGLTPVANLATPGAGDQHPHLAEHFLRLGTAFVRHSLALQPPHAVVPLVDTAVSVATACAAACHRKVSSCSLSFLAALLAAAAQRGGPQVELCELLEAHGVAILRAALLTLLAPSPLPRVHKVTSLLLELVGLAQQGLLQGPQGHQQQQQQQQQVGSPPGMQQWAAPGGAAGGVAGSPVLPGAMAFGSSPGGNMGLSGSSQQPASSSQSSHPVGLLGMQQQSQAHAGVAGAGSGAGGSSNNSCQVLLSWLRDAMQQVGPDLLPPQEGQLLLQEWGPVLGTGSAEGHPPPPAPAAPAAGHTRVPTGSGRPVSKGISAARSYLLSRRLKRLVREFAERHSRVAGP